MPLKEPSAGFMVLITAIKPGDQWSGVQQGGTAKQAEQYKTRNRLSNIKVVFRRNQAISYRQWRNGRTKGDWNEI
jgi:hypothetical protein